MSTDAYLGFLRSKIPQAEVCGFEPLSEPHPSLFPHQVDIARWMCRGGRRACFASFGMGKTRINLQLAQWVLAWCIAQFQGESGAGESYWEQFPEYQAACKIVDMARRAGILEGKG